MKTGIFRLKERDLLSQLAIGFVLIVLYAVHLPGGGSFLLLPALLLVYHRRSLLNIEPELKRIIALFILYLLFFTVVSTDPVRSAKGVYDIVRGLLVFFPAVWLGAYLTKPQGKSIAVFIGLLFILANFSFPATFGSQNYFGFYDNPNNVAVALTAHLFLLAAAYPKPHSDSKQWLLIIFIAAFCAALLLLILANSRGSWLGIAAAFSLIVLLQPTISPRQKLAAVITAGFSLVTLVFLADLKGFGYGTVGARIEIWKGLWALTVSEHIWLGYGLNFVKDILTASGLPTLTAHNIILEIFVSTGLIGLITFTYVAYRLTFFFLTQNYAQTTVLYAGIGGLTAFLIMGQFDLKFSSFKFIGTISCFLGLIYSQRLQAHEHAKTIFS